MWLTERRSSKLNHWWNNRETLIWGVMSSKSIIDKTFSAEYHSLKIWLKDCSRRPRIKSKTSKWKRPMMKGQEYFKSNKWYNKRNNQFKTRWPHLRILIQLKYLENRKHSSSEDQRNPLTVLLLVRLRIPQRWVSWGDPEHLNKQKTRRCSKLFEETE